MSRTWREGSEEYRDTKHNKTQGIENTRNVKKKWILIRSIRYLFNILLPTNLEPSLFYRTQGIVNGNLYLKNINIS